VVSKSADSPYELYKCNSRESTFVEFCVDGINLNDENYFQTLRQVMSVILIHCGPKLCVESELKTRGGQENMVKSRSQSKIDAIIPEN
jgi:hypothetical protein